LKKKGKFRPLAEGMGSSPVKTRLDRTGMTVA
jgi:hypothetical protein